MKKVFKYLSIALLAILLLLAGAITVLYLSADMGTPKVSVNLKNYQVSDTNGFRTCNGCYLRQSKSGLWEAYIHGNPLDRGVAMGRLSQDLLAYQEKVFVDQIKEIIPSESYLKFLRFFTIIFNRNLGEYIPDEYRTEIYGISLSCTNAYNFIGTPYERQLNYHAAHDIGHTMQEYMLVGCSSFAVWNRKSEDSSLLVGRNFDFYVGDSFAKNKLVSFVNPSRGYKYASVGWAGMIGVLSGMNEAGLTVTINAAKGDIPTSAAMPISILAREILQYASTIKEAYAIAQKHHTFVSESLLIGSAKDGKAAIIEKTPSQIGLFESKSDRIICTNHYQSETFRNDPKNIENIANSDSPYRYRRLEKLLEDRKPLNPGSVAKILRDRLGVNGEDIGLTNEKSLNQSIGHHSVIFKPKEGLMWVSTSPWQSGKLVCYNLKKIFAKPDFSRELADDKLSIAADSAFIRNDYPRVVEFRALAKQIKKSISTGIPLSADSLKKLVAANPNMYHTYVLLGNYYSYFNNPVTAAYYWRMALKKEIPRVNERKAIEKKIKELGK
jgi:Predicted choloylglycine hydrolase